MRAHWRWLTGGVALALGLALLVLIFLGYQAPELLLDWANLRYCG